MRIETKRNILGDSKFARGAIGIAAAAALTLGLIANTFAATAVITPGNQGDWADRSDGGSVSFVADSETSYGEGALQLGTSSDTGDKANYALQSLNMNLRDIDNLSYDTKQVASSFEAGSASLQLSTCLYGVTETDCVDGEGDDWTNLAYEPYVSEGNDAVLAAEWQTWDLMSGYFYSTGERDIGNGVLKSGYETYTLAELTDLYPNAFVAELALNVGSRNVDYTINVDAVIVNETVYDFEDQSGDTVVPTTPVALGSSSPIVACGGLTDSYTVVMDWTESEDNVGVVGYQYEVTTPNQTWVNPQLLTESSYAGSFTDGEGDYTYRVRSVDAAQNYSEWSNSCTVTYMTEGPLVVATSKDQCKKDGWKDVVRADDSEFKNQGQCVAYVSSNDNSKHHRTSLG